MNPGNIPAVRSTVKVRHQLEQQRQAGVDFAAAWTAALAALPPDEKREWLEALEDTAAAWRAAA